MAIRVVAGLVGAVLVAAAAGAALALAVEKDVQQASPVTHVEEPVLVPRAPERRVHKERRSEWATTRVRGHLVRIHLIDIDEDRLYVNADIAAQQEEIQRLADQSLDEMSVEEAEARIRHEIAYMEVLLSIEKEEQERGRDPEVP